MNNHILRSSCATAALLSLALAAAAMPQKADARTLAGFSDFGSNTRHVAFGRGHMTRGGDLSRGAVSQSITSLGSFTRAQELNSAAGRDMPPLASRAGSLKALGETVSSPRAAGIASRSDTTGGSAFNPVTGHTTTSVSNGDGTRTVIEAGRDGHLVSTHKTNDEPTGGFGYDPETGQTTTSVSNGDRTHTITVTGRDGHVISTGKSGREPIGESTSNPETGRATTPVFNPVSRSNARDSSQMSAGKTDEAGRPRDVSTPPFKLPPSAYGYDGTIMSPAGRDSNKAGKTDGPRGANDVFVPMYHFPPNTFGYDGMIMWPTGPAPRPHIRMLGEDDPSSTDDDPPSTDEADTPAEPRKEALLPCPGTVSQVKETAPEQPRRRTIEQEQADAWDRGEFWQPPKYNPTGESAFMTGVRQDKANAQADLRRDEQARHDSTMSDGLWDQVYGDPIRHDQDIIMRRDWMIAIYEAAYLHGLELGLTNLAAHAYAQIQLDQWREKSLTDFEQAFGTHFAQLGQAVSGDPLGNLQKLIAQGVPVIVVKTAAATTETAALELAEEAGAGKTVGKTVAKAPPTSGNNATILLANEASKSGKSTLAAIAAKAESTPGTYNVFIHSDGSRFGFKLGKQTIIIGAKMVKDAMIRTGYKGGTVILNACKAGCMPEGAAQQLADELGETVIAPTTVVSLAKDGTVVTAGGGVWKPFFPTLPATP